MIKKLGAIFLGVLSIPVVIVFAGLEEQGKIHSGWPSAFVLCIIMAVYFFICQFWLSRGNPHAFLKDWPSMLLLNAALFVILLISLPENLNGYYAVTSSAVLLFCFAGTLAGAFLASRAARRRARRQ